MFDIALKIFLLVTPILCIPSNGYTARFQWFQFGYFSGSVSLLQFQFFQYGVIMLFLAALFDKPKRLIHDRYIGVLFFVYILSIYFHPSTIQIFGNIFLGFLLYYLVINYTKNVKSVLKIIIFVSLLNTIFAILQSCGIHLIYKPIPNIPNIIGLMVYKTQLGIYQAIAIPICWAVNPWLAIIPAVGLLFSKSATAIIAAIIGLTIFFRKEIPKLQSPPILMSIVTIAGLFFLKSFHKFSIRLDVWVPTIEMIKKKLMHGYGFGNFEYTTLNDLVYPDPYSLYLGVAHAAGIFGLMALAAFIINKFRKFNNNTYVARGILASCLILVFIGFGYSFLDYPRLAGTAIVLFGLSTIMKQEDRPCL